MDSALPALNIDPYRYGMETNQLAAQSNLAEFNLQQAKINAPLENQYKAAVIPLEIQAKKQEAEAKTRDFNNNAIGQVVKDTMAADPDQQQQVWDDGMRKAQSNGATQAGQYIGRYRPDLAERLADYYGAASSGGPSQRQSAIDAKADEIKRQAMERQVATMPPDQLVTSIKKANMLIDSFNNVHDQQSWNAEIEYLKQNGVDPAKTLPSLEYSALNYAAVKQRIKDMLGPYRDVMMDRAMVLGIGGRPPESAPQGVSQYIGVNPDTQTGVTMNTSSGKMTDTGVRVGPKPSAAVANFQYKYGVAKRLNMSDQDAAQFANGRKSLPPERLRAIAEQDANKEYADLQLSMDPPKIADPQAWVRAKTAENFANLTQAQQTGMGTGGPGGQGAPMPQAAMDAVRKGGGRPVSFANGQIYKWVNGKAVRIK